MSWKEGKKEYYGIKAYMDASLRGLSDYIKKSKVGLITAVNNSTDKEKQNNKNEFTEMGKKKQLLGYFKWKTDEILHKETCVSLQKENLKE